MYKFDRSCGIINLKLSDDWMLSRTLESMVYLHNTKIYRYATNSSIGVCLYIGQANFAFPLNTMPLRLAGLDTSTCPHGWLAQGLCLRCISLTCNLDCLSAHCDIQHNDIGLSILQLFLFTTISIVLLMHANTLDKSHHFELGTFLNRHHYCEGRVCQPQSRLQVTSSN